MAYVERNYLTEQFEMLLHDDNIMNPVVKVLDALEIIDTAPTADVVEVVRCENCKNVRSCEHHLYCYLTHHRIEEDDYCSYGERKTE